MRSHLTFQHQACPNWQFEKEKGAGRALPAPGMRKRQVHGDALSRCEPAVPVLPFLLNPGLIKFQLRFFDEAEPPSNALGYVVKPQPIEVTHSPNVPLPTVPSSPNPCIPLKVEAANSGAACEGTPVDLLAASACPDVTNAWIGPKGFASAQQKITGVTAGASQVPSPAIREERFNCFADALPLLPFRANLAGAVPLEDHGFRRFPRAEVKRFADLLAGKRSLDGDRTLASAIMPRGLPAGLQMSPEKERAIR